MNKVYAIVWASYAYMDGEFSTTVDVFDDLLDDLVDELISRYFTFDNEEISSVDSCKSDTRTVSTVIKCLFKMVIFSFISIVLI
jgi:hypothetical protein